MKKLILLAAGAMFLAGCGGGGAGGVKLKKNDYLGDLPSLYANYNAQKAAAEKELEQKSNKMMEGASESDYAKIQKLFDDAAEVEKARKEKFKTDVTDELARVVGKDVPVTYSAALTPFFVATVKIAELRGEPRLSITLTAKENFTVPSMKGYDYKVHFKLTGNDGATLASSGSTILPIQLARESKSFGAGDVLVDNYTAYGFNLHNPDRATFTGVEFITEEEYNNLNK
jgi:hypothetical protein